jgi:hypothetical protein
VCLNYGTALGRCELWHKKVLELPAFYNRWIGKSFKGKMLATRKLLLTAELEIKTKFYYCHSETMRYWFG